MSARTARGRCGITTMWWNKLRLWWHSDGLHSLRASRRLLSVEKMPLQPADRVATFLIEVLFDPYEEVRAATAAKLGQLKSSRSVAPLSKLVMTERDPTVHGAALLALASHPAEAWIGILTQGLDDRDPKVSDAASLALRTIGWEHLDATTRAKVAVIRCDWALAVEIGPPAVPVLQSRMRSGTPLIRREAADALCKIADESSLKAIVDVLRDRRVETGARETAAWALRRMQWCEVEPIDSARAAIAMGNWSEAVQFGVDAIPPLTNALRDQNAKTRKSAAEALGTIGGREATEALGAAIVDKGLGSEIRATIAQELGRIGGDHVIAFLIAALSDREWQVRTTVAKTLAELNWKPSRPWDRALYAIAKARIEEAVAIGPTAIPALTDALRFPSVCAAIGTALAGMGPEGINVLATIAKDVKADMPLREAASTALATIGDSRAIEPLHAMLKDTDPAVRHTAVWALERLGWEPSAEADRAVFSLAHEDWPTLGKLGAGAVDPLLRYLSAESESQQAIETLQQILEKDARRIPVDQLRKIVKLADSSSGGSSPSTLTMANPATASISKAAKYELIRRGIMR